MGTRIFVGGLPFSTDESRLQSLFAQHGNVSSVRIVTDKLTGRSRGFGFVEMSTDSEAEAAIQALNGTDLDGRTLTVNEARPQESRGSAPRGQWEGQPQRGRGRPRENRGRGRW